MHHRVEYFGASVRGPQHKSRRLRNQDAWFGVEGPKGALIVVCDGLGSRPKARKGSKMACLAVRDAFRHWVRADTPSTHELVRLIEILWMIRIAPHEPQDCATTCLFALLSPSGQLLVGGLGDGMALAKPSVGSTLWIVGERGEGFANETKALGFPHRLQDWRVDRFTVEQENMTAVLATDGVSDDLLVNRIDDFVSWLMQEVAPLPPRKRWRSLCNELRNWPTPGHLDDKTIAVLNINVTLERE